MAAVPSYVDFQSFMAHQIISNSGEKGWDANETFELIRNTTQPKTHAQKQNPESSSAVVLVPKTTTQPNSIPKGITFGPAAPFVPSTSTTFLKNDTIGSSSSSSSSSNRNNTANTLMRQYTMQATQLSTDDNNVMFTKGFAFTTSYRSELTDANAIIDDVMRRVMQKIVLLPYLPISLLNGDDKTLENAHRTHEPNMMPLTHWNTKQRLYAITVIPIDGKFVYVNFTGPKVTIYSNRTDQLETSVRTSISKIKTLLATVGIPDTGYPTFEFIFIESNTSPAACLRQMLMDIHRDKQNAPTLEQITTGIRAMYPFYAPAVTNNTQNQSATKKAILFN